MEGRRIAELREAKKLSQEELAFLLNVHVTTLSRWENGHFEPKASAIQKLCAALHVSETELLNGPEKQEFEVKILMGVKELGNMPGLEVKGNSFVYGVQDDKPQIHLAGKVLIGTPEERKAAKALLLKRFDEACWMYDHRGECPAMA